MFVAELVAITALVLAFFSFLTANRTLRETAASPLRAEALRYHSDSLRKKLADWQATVPAVPPVGQAHPATPWNHRRKQLLADAWHRDFVENHMPPWMEEYPTLLEDYVAHEKAYARACVAAAKAIQPFVEEVTGLSSPPLRERTTWEGDVFEEEDDRAIGVYWPGMFDLLIAELADRRIQKTLQDKGAPWSKPSYEFARADDYGVPGEDPDEGPPIFELRWIAEKQSNVLAVVDKDQKKQVRALFRRDTLEALHERFSGLREAIVSAHEGTRRSRNQILDLYLRAQEAPLFRPGQCHHIDDAVKAAS